jgi:hypothetical protein
MEAVTAGTSGNGLSKWIWYTPLLALVTLNPVSD